MSEDSISNADSPQILNAQPLTSTDTKYKIITWNLWCMIFAPRTLSNPLRCGHYVKKIALNEDWHQFDGLILCSFQELWSWRTGLFPPFLLKIVSYFEYIPYLGVFISFAFQFLTLLLGLLPILNCLPFKYDPKKRIAAILHQFVPYAYYENHIPFRCVLDNGLLLLSNTKADKFGFVKYNAFECVDGLANKGFLYVYFADSHTLAINTHLEASANSTTRMSQLEQLRQFMNDFEDKHRQTLNSESKLKILAIGDFNIDMTQTRTRSVTATATATMCSDDINGGDTAVTMAAYLSDDSRNNEYIRVSVNDEMEENNLSETQSELQNLSEEVNVTLHRSKSYVDIPRLFGETFVKCNSCEPTLRKAKWGCLDHIFTNFEFVGFKEETKGTEGKLSDHLMIKNEFTSSQTNLL